MANDWISEITEKIKFGHFVAYCNLGVSYYAVLLSECVSE